MDAKLNKSEQALFDRIKKANEKGILAGVNPQGTRDTKAFVSLKERGLVVYVDWTPALGAGWKISA